LPVSEEKTVPLLIYPDPQIDVARVRAKQMLARACAGEPVERLRKECEAFRSRHDKAEGLLAGRKGRYAETVAALLDRPDELTAPPAPMEWKTFAADPARGSQVAVDNAALRLARLCRHGPQWRFQLESTQPVEDDREDSGNGPVRPVSTLA